MTIEQRWAKELPQCAYCAGRPIFEETICDPAIICEDCPCKMVVRNKPGAKKRLFQSWRMRILEPKVKK